MPIMEELSNIRKSANVIYHMNKSKENVFILTDDRYLLNSNLILIFKISINKKIANSLKCQIKSISSQKWDLCLMGRHEKHASVVGSKTQSAVTTTAISHGTGGIIPLRQEAQKLERGSKNYYWLYGWKNEEKRWQNYEQQ